MRYFELCDEIERLEELRDKIKLIDPTPEETQCLNEAYCAIMNVQDCLRKLKEIALEGKE